MTETFSTDVDLRLRVAALEAQMETLIGDGADRRAEREAEFHDWLDEQRSIVIKLLITMLAEAVPNFDVEMLRSSMVAVLVEPWTLRDDCSEAEKIFVLSRRARCEEVISEYLP